MNAALFGLMRLLGRRRFEAFVRDCHDVKGAQLRALKAQLQSLGQTAYARRLKADTVTGLEDFQRKVPLTRYEDMAVELEATLRGDRGALVSGQPRFFAATAGTTSARKLFPITDRYRKDFQRPMNLYAYGLMRDHPRAFRHKMIYFVGCADVDTAPCGTPIGANSGYNFKNLPLLLRRLYASPYEAFAVNDASARAYAVALTALAHEVSAAVAITTQPLAHFGEVMRTHADALLGDLADGTLRPPGELTQAERAALRPFLSRSPRRSKLLAQRAAAAGELTPRTAWPELALVSCWFHAGAGAHAAQLRTLFGPAPMRSVVYSATEGWFNVPLADADPSGVLAVGTHVFEFIPLDAKGQRTGSPVFPEALEVGRQYSLVVSSGAGLWRYQMDDVIQCTGFLAQAPQLTFVQKEGNVLCLAHDLTTEHHVRQAVDAMRAAGKALGRICFAPHPVREEGRPPRYVLFAEGSTAPAAAELDAALRKANFGYDADRADLALDPVEVISVPADRFAAFDATRATASRAGAQTKPLEFCKDAAVVAELLG